MEDIDTIFKLRYYIHDLHNQLDQLHRGNHVPSSPINQSVLTLYRGQRMKINELEKKFFDGKLSREEKINKKIKLIMFKSKMMKSQIRKLLKRNR